MNGGASALTTLQIKKGGGVRVIHEGPNDIFLEQAFGLTLKLPTTKPSN